MADRLAESTLAWWRDAGVDTIVGETPRDWLNAPTTASAAEAAPAPPSPEPLPATLAEFQAWLLDGEAAAIAAPGTPGMGPSGDPKAGLMVLIDMPGPDDAAAGRLLSGAAGDQFDRMMAAIGRSRETLYLAAMSPVRTPTARLPQPASKRLAEIARHHVGLARPKALLLFGDECAKALLGESVTAARGRWHELDTPSGPVRTLATYRPDNVLAQRSFRRPAWEDLQRLQEGLDA